MTCPWFFDTEWSIGSVYAKLDRPETVNAVPVDADLCVVLVSEEESSARLRCATRALAPAEGTSS
jgi:hypothetical protein